jgi:uncharacterized protein YqgC (DUF456 family)
VLEVLVGIAIAVGVAGTVVPVVPGLGLVVGAAFVYGVVGGFGVEGIVAFLVILALGIAGTAAGVVIPQRATAGAGAAQSSLVLGTIGAVIGFFAVPVVGLPLGGVVGIYAGELRRTGDTQQAWRATKAAVKGFGLAAVAQLGAGLLMAATWAAWVIVS